LEVEHAGCNHHGERPDNSPRLTWRSVVYERFHQMPPVRRLVIIPHLIDPGNSGGTTKLDRGLLGVVHFELVG